MMYNYEFTNRCMLDEIHETVERINEADDEIRKAHEENIEMLNDLNSRLDALLKG